MSLILNIDTATENATIAIAQDGITLSWAENPDQKDHAAWIHTAIKKLVADAGIMLNDLNAVAVTAGPGSYTGLRVGMASAKGFCFALDIPLITENTLRVMALAAVNTNDENKPGRKMLVCPMIDARRMEVFTAIFDTNLGESMPSSAVVLDPHTFDAYFNDSEILFFGNGSAKFRQLISNPNAIFEEVKWSAKELAVLSHQKFLDQKFDDIAYAEPLYLKEFYTVAKK